MKRLFILVLILMFGSALPGQTRDLRIIQQPKPDLPKDYGQLDPQGSIVLKVEFLAIGKIGKIALISSFYRGVDNLALEAAKKIKFEPKTVDGKPIDSYKTIWYDYSWEYGGWQVPPIKKSSDSSNSTKPQ